MITCARGWARLSHVDDQTFLKEFRPDMDPNTSYVVASVDNGTDPQKGGGGWESVSRVASLEFYQ